MTQNQDHQAKFLKSLIQHGLIAFARQEYPSSDSHAPGIRGVYDSVAQSYKDIGMNDELADKMTKAIYFHAIKRLLEVNSRLHLTQKELSGDYFKNKEGSNIAYLMTNPDLLREHTEEIFEDYSKYIASNIQKHDYAQTLDRLVKDFLPRTQVDRKPYQLQASVVYA